jgi:hypothetical protein
MAALATDLAENALDCCAHINGNGLLHPWNQALFRHQDETNHIEV